MPQLTTRSFAKIFGTKEKFLPPLAKTAIKKANFKYREVGSKEYDQAILTIIKTLDSKNLKVSGPHRLKDWEKGWAQHLRDFRKDKDLNILVAKFAMQGVYKRLQGNLIQPESRSFEGDFVKVLLFYLFDKYFKKVDTFYEFGAGTGVNLVIAAEMFPQMKLVGLDWANSSVDMVNTLATSLGINVAGKRFNLFKPDINYQLDNNSAVLTVGTLEQLGENFRPFIKYLLKNKPKVCTHLETLYEAYDQDNLLDYLATKYLEKRNYLKGLLPYLKKLEKEKKIKILKVRRTFGSLYHEGYTYTIWKPL